VNGIIVRYSYSGDEAAWRAVVDDFVAAIADDPAARGRFRYAVTVASDNRTRTHVGRWDSEETLKAVQSRPYFNTFSEAIQGFAGGTLQSTRMLVAASTD